MAVQICGNPGNGCENSAGCADRHTHAHAGVVHGGPANTIADPQAEINARKKRKGHADMYTLQAHTYTCPSTHPHSHTERQRNDQLRVKNKCIWG